MANFVLSGLMGLCVADALGVPVEFISREQLKAKPVLDMQGFGTYNQPSGTWSDDTSMTLCLTDSLTGELNYKDIMIKFQSWLYKGEYTPYGETFDVGITTRQAIQRFTAGTDPLECGGAGERDNGNGSLMRVLPIVFYIQSKYGSDFDKNDEAFNIIHDISALTHAHKRSKIACGIYISIASELLINRDLTSAVNSGFHKATEYYKSKLGLKDELSRYSRIFENRFHNLEESEIRSSGYVVDTLEAAIWCLLNSKSYKECALKAVNLGEDTDTVAAVAGGLAGIHYGYESIPDEWLRKITKREYIEELANKLYQSL